MLVVVPAHDEEAEIAACLSHVVAAVRLALDAADPPRVVVRVAVHRSTDDTFATAVRALAALAVPCSVVRDEVSCSVGDVRRRLVEEGSRALCDPPGRTWVLSTDADSWVPPTWIVDLLETATRTDAAAVAGLVAFRGWDPTPGLRERYARLIEAKLDLDSHTHVYGANLAVRLDAYRRVGGFRSVIGEDQDLIDRLRHSGERVVGACAPVVLTSARAPGRARGGLGDLLQRLHQEDQRIVGGIIPLQRPAPEDQPVQEPQPEPEPAPEPGASSRTVGARMHRPPRSRTDTA